MEVQEKVTSVDTEKSKERVMLTIDGKEVDCKIVDFSGLDFSKNNEDIIWLTKTKPVKVQIAEGGEKIGTSQDGMEQVAEAGQYILQNNPDAEEHEDPYIFGEVDENGKVNVESQREDFLKKYKKVDGGDDLWFKSEPFKAIRVSEDVAIEPSWDKGNYMGTPSGGVIAEGGYTIAPSSLEDSYAKVSIDSIADN